MKHKKIVSMIGVLTLLFNIAFIVTACSHQPYEPEKVEYIKEDFTFKFKNESGVRCYIEISGDALVGGKTVSFSSVLKTEVPVAEEKSITVKGVVVGGKSKLNTYDSQPRFSIKAFSDDSRYQHGSKFFVSNSKDQYTKGTFHIKLESNYFNIDFIN